MDAASLRVAEKYVEVRELDRRWAARFWAEGQACPRLSQPLLTLRPPLAPHTWAASASCAVQEHCDIISFVEPFRLSHCSDLPAASLCPFPKLETLSPPPPPRPRHRRSVSLPRAARRSCCPPAPPIQPAWSPRPSPYTRPSAPQQQERQAQPMAWGLAWPVGLQAARAWLVLGGRGRAVAAAAAAWRVVPRRQGSMEGMRGGRLQRPGETWCSRCSARTREGTLGV